MSYIPMVILIHDEGYPVGVVAIAIASAWEERRRQNRWRK